MNLQPINPAPRPDLRLVCVGCYDMFNAEGMVADFDDRPGTFYCASCAALLDPDLDSPAAEG